MGNVFPKFDTHICLVSQQSIPNLAPALMKSSRPRRVVLVVSPQMASAAAALTSVLTRYQILVERLEIPNANDVLAVEDCLLNWLATQEFSRHTLALNVTGGTKPMAMVAHQVLRENGHAVFYVDPDSNKILFLNTTDQAVRGQWVPGDMPMKLTDYLNAYGYQRLPQRHGAEPPEHPDLTDWLVTQARALGRALGQLNYYAEKASKANSLEIELAQQDKDTTNQDLDVLLTQFEEANILTLTRNRITFADHDARQYAHGGWLEEHVHRIVSPLVGQDQLARSMEVENRQGAGHARNELDVAFVAHNRLYLIECKTSNLARPGEHGNEALYKLDSLAALGGLNTRSMLVSYRDIAPATRQRAKDLRIKVVEAEQLRGLRDQIQSWMQPR